MNITSVIQWQAVDWPIAGTPAAGYAVFQDGGPTPLAGLNNTPNLYATISWNDTDPGHVYQIRPTDGSVYGPAQAIVIGNAPLGHRAWARSYLRKAIADRLDDASQDSVKISDDELNDYCNEAILQYSLQYPKDVTGYPIALQQNVRTYDLPADFLAVRRVQYNSLDGMLSFYLKDEPYKPGESATQNWAGYPKLGIIAFMPTTGRLYPGHFEVQNNALTLDWSPTGNDQLSVDYSAIRTYPAGDLDQFDVPAIDWQALTYFMQYRAWLEIESRDVNLSRWRSKEDGGRRDDLPTEKMSARMLAQWNQYLQQRRTMRPRQLRLARRA